MIEETDVKVEYVEEGENSKSFNKRGEDDIHFFLESIRLVMKHCKIL